MEFGKCFILLVFCFSWQAKGFSIINCLVLQLGNTNFTSLFSVFVFIRCQPSQQSLTMLGINNVMVISFKETGYISLCLLEAPTVDTVCICIAQYQSAASPQRLCSLWCIFVTLNISLKKP